MDIRIKKTAKKELKKIDKIMAQRILDAISDLRDFPDIQNIKRLKGKPIRYRLRIGNWRLVFSVNWNEDILTIESIKHRREVYR